ncbi:hypothetical protein CRE_00506 [Caenorhabditis remanei]|uniref:Uncharacterized protein n=1 Tax=Caenorhabditis remanei TaxID=31234 RepID=E3LCJ8_CAERE|nr:hypothetical protein CRE_00506 [Caenorhabditis remanei]
MDETDINKKVKEYTSRVVCGYKTETALKELIPLVAIAPLMFLDLHKTYDVVSKCGKDTLQSDIRSDANKIVRIIDSRRENQKKAKMDKNNDNDEEIPRKMAKLTEVRKTPGNEGKPVNHIKSSFKVGDPLDFSDLEVTPGKIMYPGLRPVSKKPGLSTGTKPKEMLPDKNLSRDSSNLSLNHGEIRYSTTFELKRAGESDVDEGMIKRKSFIPQEYFKKSESLEGKPPIKDYDAFPLKTQRLDMDVVLSDDPEDSDEPEAFSLPLGDPFNLNAILAKGNDSSPENGSIPKKPDCSKRTRYKPLGGLDVNEIFFKPKKSHTKMYAGKPKAAEKMRTGEDLNNNSSSENRDSLNKPPTPASKPFESLDENDTLPKRRISHLQQNSGKSETVERKAVAKESDNNSPSKNFGRLTLSTNSKTSSGLDRNESKFKPRKSHSQQNNRKSDTAKTMLVVKESDNNYPSKNVDRFNYSKNTDSKQNYGLEKKERMLQPRESISQINTRKSIEKVLAVGYSDDESSDDDSPSELLATIEKYDQFKNAAEKKFAKFIKREFPGKEKEKPSLWSYREWYKALKSAKEKLENSTVGTPLDSNAKKPGYQSSKVGPPSHLPTNERVQGNAKRHRSGSISNKSGNSSTGCKPTVVTGKKVESINNPRNWSDGVPAGIGRIPKKANHLRDEGIEPTPELDKKKSNRAPNPYSGTLHVAQRNSNDDEYDPTEFYLGTRPSHISFDFIKDEADKLSSADLITFLGNNEQFKKDADRFFFKFIREEFPEKLRHKPDGYSAYQWYQTLKRRADMQEDLAENNVPSSIKKGIQLTSNGAANAIDEVHRELKQNNNAMQTTVTAYTASLQRNNANYDFKIPDVRRSQPVSQTEKPKTNGTAPCTVSSPGRNNQTNNNPRNGSRPSTSGGSTGQPIRPEQRKEPMSKLMKKFMRDAQNRH